MSTAQTASDRKAQTRRTIMAALVAVLVARLVAQIPVLADALEWVDELIAEAGVVSVPALALLQAAVIAGVIWLYQRLAQALGDRWPSVEKIMLGSDARPHYVPRYAVGAVNAQVAEVIADDPRVADAARAAVVAEVQRTRRDGTNDPDVWPGETGGHS